MISSPVAARSSSSSSSAGRRVEPAKCLDVVGLDVQTDILAGAKRPAARAPGGPSCFEIHELV